METWLLVWALVIFGLCSGGVCVLWVRWVRELGGTDSGVFGKGVGPRTQGTLLRMTPHSTH